MTIKRNGSITPTKGSTETFTGDVQLEFLKNAEDPSQVSVAKVTFAPSAHTNWHRHPLGQTLIVLEGEGWVQSEGESKQTIHAGDTVWCPPNEKHWHGAKPDTTMTHYAIQESQDGKMIEWLEQVSEEEYTK